VRFTGIDKDRYFQRGIVLSLVLFFILSTNTISTHAKSDSDVTHQKEIRFGIVTFYNPRLMVLRYQPLLDALSKRTEYSYKLVLAKSYGETVEKLENGEIDFAYLGPATYIRARSKFKTTPLVRLNTGGKSTYKAVLAVRDDSKIENIMDLNGMRFAFGPPLSTSSHLYPRKILKKEGFEISNLESIQYYKHHDSAAKAVLKGDADVCGIRDIVADRYDELGLRIIATSDPIPNFPFVAGPDVSQNLIVDLRKALLSFDPETYKDSVEMSSWDYELRAGFKEVIPEDYDDLEKEMVKIFGVNAYEGSPELKFNKTEKP
jgi:phosphonate transport system substrate-binding protein